MSAFLSWNSARLIALILNSLTGLMRYYERESQNLNADSIFALRIMEGHLSELHSSFINKDFHSQIFTAIQNLSLNAGETAYKALITFKHVDNYTFAKLEPFLIQRHNIGVLAHKKIDENLRWANKNLLPRDEIHKTKTWFGHNSSEFFHCTSFLTSTNCVNITTHCFNKLIRPKGLIGFEISREIFFVVLSRIMGCRSIVDNYLTSLESSLHEDALNKTHVRREYDTETDRYISERCTNVHDEMVRFRRDKKKLARVVSSSLDLMMEQVFVCLQFGYVEFANPHFLVTALSWQHPTLGCYTDNKPESIPNMGLSSDFHRHDDAYHKQSAKDNECLAHTSSAVAIALVVYLRYLLDPGPWPELHFADQLVQIDRIIAEDQFQHFKYIEWVRDSSLHMLYKSHIILPKPPPLTWSPDLIAFVILLFVFAVGSVVAHYIWGNSAVDIVKVGGKRMYPYAFKKL